MSGATTLHTCLPTPWRAQQRPQQRPMTPQFNVVMWNLYLEVYRYKLFWWGYKCSSIYSSTTPTYLSRISHSARGLPTIHPLHLLMYHCPHHGCLFNTIRTPHASHLCLMNSFLSCFLINNLDGLTWTAQCYNAIGLNDVQSILS